MGIHYNFYITDDHLGLLSGRSCEQEAFHIKKKLEEHNGFIVFKEPVYSIEGNCICFELRNCVPKDLLEILKYDGIYYRKECDFRILDLKE